MSLNSVCCDIFKLNISKISLQLKTRFVAGEDKNDLNNRTASYKSSHAEVFEKYFAVLDLLTKLVFLYIMNDFQISTQKITITNNCMVTKLKTLEKEL